MKRILFGALAAIAMWCSQPAMANEPDDYMYIPEDVVLDDQGQAKVYVWLKTNVTEYNTFAMNVYLPEGFSIVKNSRGKYVFTWNNEDFDEVTYSHSMSYADHEGYISILGASLSNDYIMPGDNWLFYFTIQAPEGFNTYAVGSFKDIEFAEGTIRAHYFDDVDYIIRTADVAGIENVMVDGNGEEVIYNLQGIRVHAPLTPGYYIVNGQKRLVK